MTSDSREQLHMGSPLSTSVIHIYSFHCVARDFFLEF